MVPAPPFEIGASSFHVWPPGCYIQPILYFKNVAPLLDFGPSCFSPLLLNPGGGPASGNPSWGPLILNAT